MLLRVHSEIFIPKISQLSAFANFILFKFPSLKYQITKTKAKDNYI